jgi:hypothetical protein
MFGDYIGALVKVIKYAEVLMPGSNNGIKLSFEFLSLLFQ